MVRLKSRYLVLELLFADPPENLSIESSDINEAVRNSMKTLYGDYGVANLGKFGGTMKSCQKYLLKHRN
eukprot:gene13997-15455_t